MQPNPDASALLVAKTDHSDRLGNAESSQSTNDNTIAEDHENKIRKKKKKKKNKNKTKPKQIADNINNNSKPSNDNLTRSSSFSSTSSAVSSSSSSAANNDDNDIAVSVAPDTHDVVNALQYLFYNPLRSTKNTKRKKPISARRIKAAILRKSTERSKPGRPATIRFAIVESPEDGLVRFICPIGYSTRNNITKRCVLFLDACNCKKHVFNTHLSKTQSFYCSNDSCNFMTLDEDEMKEHCTDQHNTVQSYVTRPPSRQTASDPAIRWMSRFNPIQ